MAISKQVLMVAAILAMLLIGSANAYKPCASGYKDCDLKDYNGCETDVFGDVMNCGDCGAVCKEKTGYLTSCNKGKCGYTDICGITLCFLEPNASSTCKLGVCKSVCNTGYADCNGIEGEDGCETFVDGDVKNCGACGAVCKEKTGYLTSCNKGKCGYTDRCVVTLCLVEPNASSTCELGVCSKSVCNTGYADCNGLEGEPDGCETFVDGDVKNCGACGAVCKEKPGYFTNCNKGKCEYLDKCAVVRCASSPNATTTCIAGECKVTCLPGYANCNSDLQKDGCEVDVNTDIFNCGKCGYNCPKPLLRSGVEAICRKGICGEQCTEGFANYDKLKKFCIPLND